MWRLHTFLDLGIWEIDQHPIKVITIFQKFGRLSSWFLLRLCFFATYMKFKVYVKVIKGRKLYDSICYLALSVYVDQEILDY